MRLTLTQCDHFPDSSALTPALSPRERENRSPFGGDSITHGRSRVSALNRGAHGASGSDVRLKKDARGQFPLPVGEGQGEGEGSLQLSGTRRFALRGTLFPFVYRPAVIGQRMRGALLQRPPNCVADGLFSRRSRELQKRSTLTPPDSSYRQLARRWFAERFCLRTPSPPPGERDGVRGRRLYLNAI